MEENGALGMKVMTDEQMEMLRKQISVYATISENLVQMHKVISSQHDFTGMMPMPVYGGPFKSYDFPKIPCRQRWAPKSAQLQILEGIFGECDATPDRQKIREITTQLAQHGPISETNVYNWFQNRRARSKRKQQSPLPPLPVPPPPPPTNNGKVGESPAKNKETNHDDEPQLDENVEYMINPMYFQSPEIEGIDQLMGQPEVAVNYNPHWQDLLG